MTSPLQLRTTDVIFLYAGCLGRNYGCNGRIKLSSTTLESYGSLLSNEPSLAIIRAVLAMIEHERSASKTRIPKVILSIFLMFPLGIPLISL